MACCLGSSCRQQIRRSGGTRCCNDSAWPWTPGPGPRLDAPSLAQAASSCQRRLAPVPAKTLNPEPHDLQEDEMLFQSSKGSAPPVGRGFKHVLDSSLPGDVRGVYQLFSVESSFLWDFMQSMVGEAAAGQQQGSSRAAAGQHSAQCPPLPLAPPQLPGLLPLIPATPAASPLPCLLPLSPATPAAPPHRATSRSTSTPGGRTRSWDLCVTRASTPPSREPLPPGACRTASATSRR
jgi:hypothetical protein